MAKNAKHVLQNKIKLYGINDLCFNSLATILVIRYDFNFFLFQVNAIYLEKCIDKLSEEELMDVKVMVLTSCLLELTLF